MSWSEERLRVGRPTRERGPGQGARENGEKRLEKECQVGRTNQSCDGGGEKKDARFSAWAPGEGELMLREGAQGIGEDVRDG